MEENKVFSETSYLLESERTQDLLRLGGTSQNDTNSRRGQSAMVTGVSYNGNSLSRPFTSYDSPTLSEPAEIQTDVQVSCITSARPTRESISKGIV